MTNELTIESMAYLGAGIARTDEGKVLFVQGAVAGDRIRPLKVVSQPRHEECLDFELMEPSSVRVAAPCRYASECGGCPWQMMGYDEQLRWKRSFVVDALKRIGKLPDCEALVGACAPSPQQWHYRNKVELNAFIREGKLCLGLCQKESHEQVAIDECLLLPKALAQLPTHLAGALNYSLKEAGDRLLRVALRHSQSTGSTELALFMQPCGVNRSLLTKILNGNKEYSSLVRVITDGAMAERKVKKVEVLTGAGCWQEVLADNRYKISAPSFFQTNSAVAEVMIAHLNAIVDGAGLHEDAPVADLYSGAGTFTLHLARRFRKVSAIESLGSSIRDLRRNLEEAGLAERVTVIGGDVARELKSLGPQTLVVIDPPRSGLKPDACCALLKARPRHLVYVSCNPTTMARDVGFLAQDYRLLSVTPFDQFPQSYHVETIAELRIKD